jgi:glucose-1-phosphate thymidylyltransferase
VKFFSLRHRTIRTLFDVCSATVHNSGCRSLTSCKKNPNGLAQALILGEEFLAGDKCALILGDNLFHGPGLGTYLRRNTDVKGALIFAYQVSDPSAYGVVEFDEQGKVLSIEEKPITPKSSYAIPGIYFYDEKASKLAHQLTPSGRGELEISALNNAYLKAGELKRGSLVSRDDVARHRYARVAL